MTKKMDSAGRSESTDFAVAAATFQKFCLTIQALRDRQRGCQWMIEQTHQSLRRYLIEEAYETVDAINQDSPRQISEELGDVLLQVVLHSQIGDESGTFSITDAIDSIDAKMRRRHPHVFETGEGIKLTIAEIEERYEKIKAAEKAGQKDRQKSGGGFFSEVERLQPALHQAFAIGKQARKIKFDWTNTGQIFAHFESEVRELKNELEAAQPDAQKIADELGDVFFTLVQVARHLQLDPETVALDGNRKFLRRFARMEALAAQRHMAITAASPEQLEDLWREAKIAEKNKTAKS